MRALIQFPAIVLTALCRLVPRSGSGIAVTLTVLAAGANLAHDAQVDLSFATMQASAGGFETSEWVRN